MVTLYMEKDGTVIKISGTKIDAYKEGLRLGNEGWKPIRKAVYDAKKKDLLKGKKEEVND